MHNALFQDRFKDVQVGSRWFSTLYILSPNFHTKYKLTNTVPRSTHKPRSHRSVLRSALKTKQKLSRSKWPKSFSTNTQTQITPDNKQRFKTHSVGLEPTNVVGSTENTGEIKTLQHLILSALPGRFFTSALAVPHALILMMDPLHRQSGEDHFLEFQKLTCLRPRKWDCAVTFFA